MWQRKKESFFNMSKTFFLIPFFCIYFSLQTTQAAEPQMLVPVGKTVGVTMDTRGLLVLGTGSVTGKNNHTYTPCKGILQAGDLLLEANGQVLENKEMFMETVENSKGNSVLLRVERSGREKELSVTPVFSTADGAYKIGAWIRDSIQGIGTVTFFDPHTQSFGALGHGVYDVDTDELMEIREGALTEATLTEIVKGQKGKAGELTGQVDLQKKLAYIEQNTKVGIFGEGESAAFAGKKIPVAKQAEVRKGKAMILSDLEGGAVKDYEIEIEEIRKNDEKEHKDLQIRITDEKLLKLTGGIVQGMSGSPIIQDGRFVGAVTYVMLNQPERGYGILLEHMTGH